MSRQWEIRENRGEDKIDLIVTDMQYPLEALTRHRINWLNALLTRMDGFSGADSNKPVFVLAATNYGAVGENDGIDSPDDAPDRALLRRFDNKIYVDFPRESEREADG